MKILTLNRKLHAFSRREGGGVAMEWLVLVAAAVGLGLASVTAVRTGVETLGRDSGDSLTHATVVATNSGTGGSGTGGSGTGGGGTGTPDVSYPTTSLTYTLRHYDQNTFNSLQAWVATDFTDSTVTQEYAYQVGVLQANMTDSALARETLDWIYVMAYEITRRGLSYPSGTLTFDQVVASYEASIRTPVPAPSGTTPRTPRVAPSR